MSYLIKLHCISTSFSNRKKLGRVGLEEIILQFKSMKLNSTLTPLDVIWIFRKQENKSTIFSKSSLFREILRSIEKQLKYIWIELLLSLQNVTAFLLITFCDRNDLTFLIMILVWFWNTGKTTFSENFLLYNNIILKVLTRNGNAQKNQSPFLTIVRMYRLSPFIVKLQKFCMKLTKKYISKTYLLLMMS